MQPQQTTTNPYAPPRAVVEDITVPQGLIAPAGRGERFGASLLDSLIFAVMVYLPVIAGSVFLAGAGVTNADGINVVLLAIDVVSISSFVLWWWLTITYMKRNGQSIAKKMIGIKVVRSDGSPASLGRLIWLRNVVNLAISIVPLYGILDSLFIFGEARQCLHDKIADTIVIKA